MSGVLVVVTPKKSEFLSSCDEVLVIVLEVISADSLFTEFVVGSWASLEVETSVVTGIVVEKLPVRVSS